MSYNFQILYYFEYTIATSTVYNNNNNRIDSSWIEGNNSSDSLSLIDKRLRDTNTNILTSNSLSELSLSFLFCTCLCVSICLLLCQPALNQFFSTTCMYSVQNIRNTYVWDYTHFTLNIFFFFCHFFFHCFQKLLIFITTAFILADAKHHKTR